VVVALLIATVTALVLILALVQLGSDGVFSQAGAPQSLPAHVPAQLGVAIYRALHRVAPAPYVDAMLAYAAIDRGDLANAQRYAARLPQGDARSDLLGRIAWLRGDHATAQRDFIAAVDVFGINGEVDALDARDPRAAYALEMRFRERLAQGSTHPDALADADWRLGVLAAKLGMRPAAMAHYRSAVALSPLSEKYLISAGFQAYDLHDDASAKQYFGRAIKIDPGSADAYAGAGMTELRLGNRAAAIAYASRSRACDPNSHALRTLEAQLR
jgi:tetratricopeptide (TPR) repeat protein